MCEAAAFYIGGIINYRLSRSFAHVFCLCSLTCGLRRVQQPTVAAADRANFANPFCTRGALTAHDFSRNQFLMKSWNGDRKTKFQRSFDEIHF